MIKDEWKDWPRDILKRLIIKDASHVRELTRIVSHSATAQRDLQRQIDHMDAVAQAAKKSTVITIDFGITAATRAQVLREILEGAKQLNAATEENHGTW